MATSPRRYAVALALLAALAACGKRARERESNPGAPAAEANPPAGAGAVVLMIGDGMGRGQLEVASRYAHGEPGELQLQQLPVHGTVATNSRSGVTDSAAAATTMASGVLGFNQRVGENADGEPVENVFQLARARGWRTGVVTTSALPHATIAGFTAYGRSRYDLAGVADDQVRRTRPDVMLGGGLGYFAPAGPMSARNDGGLLDELSQLGYRIVRTRDELLAVGAPERLFGAFAPHHLDFVRERTPDTTQPTLAEMTAAALRALERDGASFLLVVEGARIDHAAHGNSVADVVAEVLAFDDAVATVIEWIGERDDVTLIVTADHETGGLAIVEPAAAGAVPTVSWRQTWHSGADVDLYARGPGAAMFDGNRSDHRWIHALIAARINATRPAPPE